ncbi:MAG: sigma-70 family RNA polymerase sigma factor [Ignavibacterium sp.]|nr:sigma-70 family RNA polymerase sigma factor [Ignavibacterium sp.]MCX7610144.1 sigma-70 family RNA polymerase sigma factor [Ignavibacterium sp.]MDW8375329.1 sigma-70 family RNA polymerase sigma factor [Ignavibacteriales bacterium]
MNLEEQPKENEMEQPKILTLDDDFSLIKRINQGEKELFRVLMNRHKEKVRNIIYMTLSEIDAIDDIAQEVFITVFKNLKNFRYESQFTTWLYRITINKCKDYLRKKKVRKIFSSVDEDYDFTSTEIDENKDIRLIVRKAIDKLPEKLRIPMILRDIEGFSYQEISETLELDLGTVKSRIFRAREALRLKLEPIKKELMI